MSNHDKVLAKVRALLDQAEATDYEEEAHAFISGAERLMAKYGIEEALVLAAGKPVEDTIGFRRFYVDAGKYESPRLSLVSRLARAHGLTQIIQAGRREWSPEMKEWNKACFDSDGHRLPLEAIVRGPEPKRKYVKWIEGCGFESDLDYVDMLVTSLSLQAAEAVHAPEMVAKMRSETNAPGHVIAWKNAFLIGFTDRVSDRIRQARKEATREAEEAFAAEQAEAETVVSTSVELALRDKDQAVKSVFDTKYPKLGAGRASSAGSYGGSGRSAGRAAGGRARLGGGTAVKSGAVGALSR